MFLTHIASRDPFCFLRISQVVIPFVFRFLHTNGWLVGCGGGVAVVVNYTERTSAAFLAAVFLELANSARGADFVVSFMFA